MNLAGIWDLDSVYVNEGLLRMLSPLKQTYTIKNNSVSSALDSDSAPFIPLCIVPFGPRRGWFTTSARVIFCST